jgi:hypothetical protein
MIRVGAFVLIFLVGPAMAAKVNVTYCAQAHEIASSRLKWALTRQRDSKVILRFSTRIGAKVSPHSSAIRLPNDS